MKNALILIKIAALMLIFLVIYVVNYFEILRSHTYNANYQLLILALLIASSFLSGIILQLEKIIFIKNNKKRFNFKRKNFVLALLAAILALSGGFGFFIPTEFPFLYYLANYSEIISVSFSLCTSILLVNCWEIDDEI